MDLNTTDRLILAKLQEGRAKPAYLASELGKHQPYISNRLKRLVDNGVVTRIDRALYGLAELETGPVNAKQIVKHATDEELLTGQIGRVMVTANRGSTTENRQYDVEDEGTEADAESEALDDESRWDEILFGEPYDPMDDTK